MVWHPLCSPGRLHLTKQNITQPLLTTPSDIATTSCRSARPVAGHTQAALELSGLDDPRGGLPRSEAEASAALTGRLQTRLTGSP